MRVALLGTPAQNNAVYRAFLPAVMLPERGHKIAWLRGTEGAIRRRLEARDFDLAHVYRGHDRLIHRIVEELHAQGVAIVWDNDDDLTELPDTSIEQRNRGQWRSQRIQSALTRMVRLADVVTTTSPVLAEQYRASGATCVHVIENHIPKDFLEAPRRKRDEVVAIIWTAGGEHKMDAEELGMRATLRRLIDTHENVHVASLGVDLGLDRDRYFHRRVVRYPDLANVLATADIGIAPLHDHRFNHARSNVKLKEYASAGLPWLASPIGPYAGMGERQGGRLVSDDRWYEELERLVLDAKARRKLAKRADKWVRTQTVEGNVDLWEDVFNEALERAKVRRSASVSMNGVAEPVVMTAS